ncbi:MAG: phospholipase C, phosphocholine-specific [Chitinophagaceae bacterium]|nr:MAG: phospholipase C, phosphocholine-specific [Chitinophagaceae bacterium]
MNNSRRDFLKKATILATTTGITNVLPTSIIRAASIDAAKGTTFYDAEHIVFLMQENRSFDHIFGSLKGVRGFNNPRAKKLPDGNKVWIQKGKDGKAFAPFHMDINETKITWQGGLPHSWSDQSKARNDGKYDKWIPEKSPLCMGYFNRKDVPFYYALADAFTVFDHYFCSSLTGTTPNRLFYWTGNVRPETNGKSIPVVNNSQAESRNNVYVDWTTVPEILEKNDISWKIYQNEVWSAKLEGKNDYWLGNYGDNAIEYVKRHQVKLSAYFRKNGDKTTQPALSAEEVLAKYNQLSPFEKNLIDKAFTTNIESEDYLKLENFTFKNNEGIEQSVEIPKEDLFYQFRKDVESGQLPTVSWLVAPESFSDHTSSPFYGTWYVSQALDILTQNPEVWKKTIFILNYDENDGYFDHLAPFVVPGGQTDGKVSKNINVDSDFAAKEKWPIGLGYRVPMVIASPWTKGGYVNSEITDHTSTLMFLEKFLTKKTGKKIQIDNISSWRRNICGDLTNSFKKFNGEKYPLPDFEKKDEVITQIQKAKNKPKLEAPILSESQIEHINSTTIHQTGFHQEKGTRPSCPLYYKLHADAVLDKVNKKLNLKFSSEKFKSSIGAPFNMYTPSSYDNNNGKAWAYAVAAGDTLNESLDISKFADSKYHLIIDGPNGFQRQISGTANEAQLNIHLQSPKRKLFGNTNLQHLQLTITNIENEPITLSLTDHAYKKNKQEITIDANQSKSIHIDCSASSGWYDFSIQIKSNSDFLRTYCGHIDTGKESITDPFMGNLL